MAVDNVEDPLRARLAPFLDSNPDSEYVRVKPGVVIRRPWGDPTIELRIGEHENDVIDALNAVFLPPRFVALWHRDTKDLEVIWTLVPEANPRRTRAFDFRFRGRTHRCGFGDPSARLLAIAGASRPIAPPNESQHRNLAAFSIYLHNRREHPTERTDRPTSFWIRAFEWDEAALVDLANHINFYAVYFDRRSPRISVLQSAPALTARRLIPGDEHAEFPSVITARPLEPYLLVLWATAQDVQDPFRRFIYNFQILEYAAFYHVQDTLSTSVRRILSVPETPGRLGEVVRQILEVMVEGRMDDDAKLNAVIKQVVDPAVLWQDIEREKDFFSVDAEFEGGFTVAALLKREWGLDDFRTAWHPKFADSVRKIRNALVHAREARQAKGIAPTPANLEKLRPWTRAVSNAAVQAMLYYKEF